MGTPVSIFEKITINGSEQWFMARGDDRENPVILFLHGGPGTSQLTLMKRNTKALERHFVIVNWDQRGAGKSYHAGDDTTRMTIPQFVDDVQALTRQLCSRFRKEKILLAGHSWGSVIGVMAAQKWPELFHCYVGIGQVARMLDNEKASYDWTLAAARAANNRKAVRRLEDMGAPPYSGDWHGKTVRQRGLLAWYGGECYNSRTGALRYILPNLIFSREYSIADRINVFRGIFRSMRVLWPTLMDVDLFVSVPELAAPVYFMLGRHDHEASSNIAEKYFHALRAPSKQLIWFEKSGHLPNSEERDTFNRVLVDFVRQSVSEPSRSQTAR